MPGMQLIKDAPLRWGGGTLTPPDLRVLVTGGAGFIGRKLVGHLLADGRSVTVLDDLSARNSGDLPRHPWLKFIPASVLDEAAVRESSRGAHLIFHLASLVGMRRVVPNLELTYQTSVKGALNVLKWTGNAPVVLFSSSAVYGHLSGGNTGEGQEINEETPLAYDGGHRGYASGKWQMERLGLEASVNGRPVMILRPFNIVGTGQNTDGMVIPTFVDKAIANMPIPVFDDGLQTRAFGCVDYFIGCLMRLVAGTEAWRTPRNIINLGSSRQTSILDLAKIIKEETQSHSCLEFIPFDRVYPGLRDVRTREANTQRLEGLIGPVKWPDIRTIIRSILLDLDKN